MIEIKNLNKIYLKGKKNMVHALNNINLKIDDRETVAIIGESGAGKSTLLHIMSCIDNFDGEYYLDNIKITTSTFNSQINSIKVFDFEFDNYRSGFKVDNVKIQNLDNLGASEIEKNAVQVYPNPSSDFINFKGLKDVEQISVIDATGKLFHQSNSVMPIDVKTWKSGLYLIKIKSKDSEFTTKFIKK